MIRKSLVALSLIVSLFNIAPAKQNPPSQKEHRKDDVVRISVTLVQVDVTVTDRKGRPVTDLRPEDFELYEDGRPQHITSFSYVSGLPSSEASGGATARQPDKSAPLPPPARLKPADVRRTMALVVDDLSLSFGSAYYVRQALKKFVDEQMEPGDLVAIIRTGAGMGALQQFTNDKRLLYAAIERVRWNLSGIGRISAFAPINTDEPSQSQAERLREQIFSVGTLGALNFIVRGLSEMPGRKSVVLFSDGLSLYNDRGDGRVVAAVRRLVDLANRASVVVYTIDPRGLQYFGLTAADHVCFT